MQFGVFFNLELPRPWRDGGEHELFKDALEQAELADQVGIEYAWAMEHHFLEEYSHSSSPEVLLAACSQRTKHIRLGHGIVLMPPAYNHPARVAERIATLDLVSDGRVEWGIGSSSSRMELEGFNIANDQKHDMCMEAAREAAKMMCSTPYQGFDGRYFSLPTRNVVPKPVQKPHPPMWIACTNRATIRMAASCGLGALTFGFTEPSEGKYWVDEYYSAFKEDCTPLGRAVNPNIAMVSSLMCHEDGEVARARGLDGWEFFKYALSHYYVTGTHFPGEFDIWQDFLKNRPEPRFSVGGIGDPSHIRANMAMFEEIGVDQIIFVQQGGRNRHDHVCESLELFSRTVLPEFQDRHAGRELHKTEMLAPYVDRAMSRVPPLPSAKPVLPVESYPVLFRNGSSKAERLPARIAVRNSLTVRTVSPTTMEFRFNDSAAIRIESNAVRELIPALLRGLDGSRPWVDVVDDLDHIASPRVARECLERLYEQGILVEHAAAGKEA
jgi:alkanesulfonate monooxygenase SsuD/methylene tetrahydromethanopterin reductase-like flavin-dependent oxidoreductase (luciferase family)